MHARHPEGSLIHRSSDEDEKLNTGMPAVISFRYLHLNQIDRFPGSIPHTPSKPLAPDHLPIDMDTSFLYLLRLARLSRQKRFKNVL